MQITLKAARVNANLTQKEVAEKLGISRETIINWEKGKRLPKMNVFAKLCEIYNVEAGDIFFGK